MAETRRGRPDRRTARVRKQRFLQEAEDAPTFSAAIDQSGFSPAAVVRLLDELGLKPHVVVTLLGDPALPATIAALRGETTPEAAPANPRAA